MGPEFWIWAVGNLVMPAIPVACVLFAQLTAGKSPTVESVLEDGVLFFYAVATSAILIMDVLKDRLGEQPKIDAMSATAYISFGLVFLIFASGAYFVTALAHTGRLDGEGHPFNMRHLAHLSWQSATAMTILSLIARLRSGLY